MASEIVPVNDYGFEFNPPIHPSARFVAVNPTNPGSGLSLNVKADSFYDEKNSEFYDVGGGRQDKFLQFRLGRIVMGDEAMSWAVQAAGRRYGFRFLYNPQTISGSQDLNTSFIPNPQSPFAAVLQEGIENISFRLLLNRIPDVIGGATAKDYYPQSITEGHMLGLKERGTHYDLEYLYRVANGIHNTLGRKDTGDIGLLLPNPAEMFIGPYRTRGALESISVEDIMFNESMVPVLSWVDITFRRFLSMDEADYEELKKVGVRISGADENNSNSDSGGGGGNYNPTGEKLSGEEVYKLARSVGWNKDESVLATKIAYAESGWRPGAHNPDRSTGDNSYGLWQINMIEKYQASRLKQFNLSKPEDLFDAATNARVAYKMQRGRGNWKDWSTYNRGEHNKAPSFNTGE